MEKIKYSSYAEIDRQLEILKLEREINFKKVVLSVQKTQEILSPEYVVNGVLEPYVKLFSKPIFQIIEKMVPYVLGWILNRNKKD